MYSEPTLKRHPRILEFNALFTLTILFRLTRQFAGYSYKHSTDPFTFSIHEVSLLVQCMCGIFQIGKNLSSTDSVVPLEVKQQKNVFSAALDEIVVLSKRGGSSLAIES